MWLTKEDAVEMYARFLVARHGLAASSVARERAAWFQAAGDADGHLIYHQVADNIDRRQSRSKMFRQSPELQPALLDF